MNRRRRARRARAMDGPSNSATSASRSSTPCAGSSAFRSSETYTSTPTSPSPPTPTRRAHAAVSSPNGASGASRTRRLSRFGRAVRAPVPARHRRVGGVTPTHLPDSRAEPSNPLRRPCCKLQPPARCREHCPLAHPSWRPQSPSREAASDLLFPLKEKEQWDGFSPTQPFTEVSSSLARPEELYHAPTNQSRSRISRR